MDELEYERLQEIELSATEKLLKYIAGEIQEDNILDKLDFYYPDFGEHKHKLAFNFWISMDFIGDDGKTFIEKFLQEKSSSLSDQEKSILLEKKSSKISLYEILDVNGEFMKVLDLLQNSIHILWEPELVSMISKGDFIFSRIGNLLGHMTFVGDINYLPNSVKDLFIEEILLDFNRLRRDYPTLTMEDYLKKHSINIYRIYTNSVFEVIEMHGDIDSIVYDELDEFEGYLQREKSSIIIKKHISNLIDFFEYYLADEELTLYHINEVDLDEFFRLAIEDGFIACQEDLNAYITTFKTYLRFLSNKDHSYKDIYNESLKISQSRFKYMNKLKYVKSPFIIDKELSNSVTNYLNEDAISIIMDYDKFMLYILNSPLSLTEKKKHIRKEDLLQIDEILESSTYIDKKSPTQKDFPIIDMFVELSYKLGLISIDDNVLSITQKGTNYLRLSDEDKYALFFQFIWDNDFISKISSIENAKLLENIKKDMVSLLSSLAEDQNYEISTILSRFSNYPRFFYSYYLYLQSLGIIRCNLYPNYEIKVTPLGKVISRLFLNRGIKKPISPVIHLETYKKG